VFEGDSLLVVESLNQGFPCLKNYGQIIKDTRVVLKSFHFSIVQHVKSHMLATLALSPLIKLCLVRSLSCAIHHIVMMEQVSY
jgi:hypothetical protein